MKMAKAKAKSKSMYVLSERDMSPLGELEVLPKLYKSVKAAKKSALQRHGRPEGDIEWDDDDDDDGGMNDGNSPGSTACGIVDHWEYSIWAVK
jgi:hypothetical protein